MKSLVLILSRALSAKTLFIFGLAFGVHLGLRSAALSAPTTRTLVPFSIRIPE
jgi:hypothetical protein